MIAIGPLGLENVQTRFIRFVSVLLGFDYRTAPIHDLQLQLNLMPLHTRRIINDLLFLRKLINSNIDAPDLLVKLDFRTSRHLRHTHLFARRQYSTQYLFHSTFPRLQLLANSMPDDIDLFCTSYRNAVITWITTSNNTILYSSLIRKRHEKTLTVFSFGPMLGCCEPVRVRQLKVVLLSTQPSASAHAQARPQEEVPSSSDFSATIPLGDL
ncbi:hypothetical protein J6590_081625 [Homalodisca vitripennis]|nr:hypothetical protein J6590_081625 [Homalodisca vitripennis]